MGGRRRRPLAAPAAPPPPAPAPRARAGPQPVRALVTGGAGFIGSHLVDALLDAGDEVTVVDHLHARRRNLEAARARGAALVRGDVTDVAAMRRRRSRAARPEVVYHLAAQIDVRRSVEDPSTDAHVNVGGTAAVLTRRARRRRAAGRAGLDRRRLRRPASACRRPRARAVAPLSPYGASKAAAESYLALLGRLHGLSTLSLRMSNVYGPRQNPHGEAGVIAIFCGAAVERRAGDDLRRRRPDARLRLRRRRGRGVRARRPLGRAGRAQRLAPAARRASPELATTLGLRQRRRARRASARSAARAWTRARRPTRLGWCGAHAARRRAASGRSRRSGG